MSPDEHRSLYTRFVDEVINQGRFEVGEELLAEDFVDHTPQPGLPGTRAGYLDSFRGIRQAFPDIHVSVEDLVVEEDKVAGRGSAHGTNTGPMVGPMGEVPPTGRAATWSYINIIRVVDGKAVEAWSQQDTLAMMGQLGLLPPPGQ